MNTSKNPLTLIFLAWGLALSKAGANVILEGSQPALRGLQSAVAPSCEYDSSNPSDDSCSMANLQASGGRRFEVYPSGETRCGLETVDGQPNPYFFQVDVGTNGQENNIVIGFQGGGAFLGYAIGDPDNRLVPSLNQGGLYQQQGNGENPFQDWTKVVVTYCTGDIHVGEGMDMDQNGNEFVFNGKRNTLTVLKWIQENIPSPDSVLIYGSSAGSLGVQFWSNTILSYYKSFPIDERPVLSVAMDSSTGLSEPTDTVAPFVIDQWNFCVPELGFTAEEIEQCKLGLFANEDIQKKSQSKHRDVPFAYLQYKFDGNNYDRYCLETPCSTSPTEFYNLLKDYLRGFLDETNNNVLSYWVNDKGHVMATSDSFFEIDEGIPLKDFLWNLATNQDGDPAILPSACVEIDVPANINFDVSCDPDLLAASFVSSGQGPTSPPPPTLPCPCSCQNGASVFLTRPASGEVRCVVIDRAIKALEKLSDVACLETCP